MGSAMEYWCDRCSATVQSHGDLEAFELPPLDPDDYGGQNIQLCIGCANMYRALLKAFLMYFNLNEDKKDEHSA